LTGGSQDGWPQVKVGDVLTLRNGRAFKSSEWQTSGTPIIRIQNLKSPDAPLNYFNGELPDQFAVRAGDLLFAWSGTPGTSFGAHVWDGPDAWLNQHIFRVDFSTSDFDRNFLKYALNRNVGSYIEQAQGGVGLAHITKTKLNASLLPMPSLDEQRRIAKYLDEIEARRSSIADRLAAARAIVDRLRAAVLGSEFAMLARATQLVPLESVLREPLKNGYSARPVAHITSTRVLTLTATTSGHFDSQHFKYTDEEIPTDSPLWLERGDVLIQRGNTAELVGMPAVYDGGPREFIYPDLMIRARVSHDIDPRYVWYMLLAPQSRAFLRDRAIGTAGNMPKINQKTVNSLPLPLTSKEEQDIVIGRVAAALDAAGRLSKAISAAKSALDAAIRGALAKAFRGGLGSDLEPTRIQADGVMSQNGKPALRA
jgi:type I restriction enzyme S subunit